MLDLGTSFLASVERDPDALAIVDGEMRLTYRDWYGKVSALAAALGETGLTRGDHVLTAMQNRWENASLHWACQFLGLIVTPLNWRAKADEIDFGIADADAKAVFYEASTEEAVRQSRLAQDLPQFSAETLASIMSGSAPDAVPVANAADWSLMLYTSGTTSKPKGVPRRHRAERAGAVAHVAQNLYRHGERTLGVMPLYHTMGVRSPCR